MCQIHHVLHVAVAHLDHRAQFFIEQHTQRVALHFVKTDGKTDVSGKGHLAQCH